MSAYDCGMSESHRSPVRHFDELDRIPLLLDGPTGTELSRRGYDVNVPGWSASALVHAAELLRSIHADYVAAGAALITANTFRTHARNVEQAALGQSAAELTNHAVRLAREAAGGRALIAGSQAPLEDCYSPHLVPPDSELRGEHRSHAHNLAAAGADLILIETMSTIREAVAASEAARETGLPFFVSFVCRADPAGRLLSGESLADAARAILPHGPTALLINCLPAPAAAQLLPQLRAAAPDLPLGVYANTAQLQPDGRWTDTPATDPAIYARHAADWLAAGAKIIGGCCGATPAHIAALADQPRQLRT